MWRCVSVVVHPATRVEHVPLQGQIAVVEQLAVNDRLHQALVRAGHALRSPTRLMNRSVSPTAYELLRDGCQVGSTFGILTGASCPW